jgi:hypothetical protein
MSSEGVSVASERSKTPSRETVPLTNVASTDLFGSTELEFCLVARIPHFMTFSHPYCEEPLPRVFLDSLRLNGRLRGSIPSFVAVMIYIERLGNAIDRPVQGLRTCPAGNQPASSPFVLELTTINESI